MTQGLHNEDHPATNLTTRLVDRWLSQVDVAGSGGAIAYAEPYLRRYLLPQAVAAGAPWQALLRPTSVAWMHPAALWDAARLWDRQVASGRELELAGDQLQLVRGWRELSHLWRCSLSDDASAQKDVGANLDALRHHLMGKGFVPDIAPSHWTTIWHHASDSTPGRFDVFDSGVQKVAVLGERGQELIVSGHRDGVVRTWDAGTLQEVGEGLRVHKGGVGGLVIAERSLGEQVVVSGGVDRSLAVSRFSSGGAVLIDRFLHDSEIDALGTVRLEPGQDGVVAGCRSGELSIRRLTDGAILGRYHTTGTQPRDVASASRGTTSTVWVATRHGQVLELAVSQRWGGAIEFTDTGVTVDAGSELWAVAVKADEVGGMHVVAGGNDGALHRWIWGAEPILEPSIEAHEGGIYSIVASAAGGFITGGGDGAVRVWLDGADPTTLDSAGMVGRINGLTFTSGSDGNGLIVAASSSSMGRVWNWPSQRLGGQYSRPRFYRINSVNVSVDARGEGHAVTCGDGNEMLKWDLVSGFSERLASPPFTDRVSGISAYAASGRQRVVAGSYDGSILSWALDDPTETAVLSLRGDAVEALATVKDSTGPPLLATGHGDGRVIIRDLQTGEILRSVMVGGSVVLSLATPPERDDSPLIVAGLDGGEIVVFDSRTQEGPVQMVGKHEGAVRSLRCDLSGQELLVASAGDDDVVRAHGVQVGSFESSQYWYRSGFRGRVLTRLDIAGQLVLLGAGDASSVSAWDFMTGHELCYSLALPDRPSQMVTLPNDESRFILASGGLSLLKLTL